MLQQYNQIMSQSNHSVIMSCLVVIKMFIFRCSVRVVKSWRAGVGKSLYKKRMVTDLKNLIPNATRQRSPDITVPLHEKTVDIDCVMSVFLRETLPPNCKESRIFHLDIAHEVCYFSNITRL